MPVLELKETALQVCTLQTKLKRTPSLNSFNCSNSVDPIKKKDQGVQEKSSFEKSFLN